MLSPGGAFKSHQAETGAGVSPLTHADTVLHILTVKHDIINPFFCFFLTSPLDDEMGGTHQEEESGIKARARGFSSSFTGPFPDQRWSRRSKITEQLGGAPAGWGIVL